MKPTSSTVVIAGGSGFLGQHLKIHLETHGYSVFVLTRRPKFKTDIEWDGRSTGRWVDKIDGSFALINLSGRTVDCRYNKQNRAAILNSRLESTRVLHAAVDQCESPPKVWLNSSTSTIYNDTRGDAPANTEAGNNIGDDFSMGVARSWEAEFFKTSLPDTIQTALRIAIVLGSNGGAFPVMSQIAKFGLCSPQGSGDQWISWIHVDDFCRAVKFLIEKPVEGCVNVCSTKPIQNRDFNLLLKKELNPLITIPQPVWLLRIGAVVMRTQTELILKSRKVAPQRLVEAGFEFRFEEAVDAVQDLTGKAD